MTRHDHVARFDLANAVRPVTKETDTRHEPTLCQTADPVQRPAQSARDSRPAVRREERLTYMEMGKEQYVNVAYQIAVCDFCWRTEKHYQLTQSVAVIIQTVRCFPPKLTDFPSTTCGKQREERHSLFEMKHAY